MPNSQMPLESIPASRDSRVARTGKSLGFRWSRFVRRAYLLYGHSQCQNLATLEQSVLGDS